MKYTKLAALVACLICTTPGLAQAEEVPARNYEAEIADQLRQIEILETTKAESRAEYQEKRRQIAVLEDRIDEMRNVQRRTEQAAVFAAADAATAKAAATEALQAESEAKKSKAAAAGSERNIAEVLRNVMRWLMGNVLVLLVLLGVAGYLIYSFRTFKVWAERQLISLSSRVTSLEDRYVVKIDKISVEEDAALHTLLPAELKLCVAGMLYNYFIRVNGEIARYQISLRGLSEQGTPLIGHDYDNKGVTPKHFHKKLAELIEANGGAHPHTVYQS